MHDGRIFAWIGGYDYGRAEALVKLVEMKFDCALRGQLLSAIWDGAKANWTAWVNAALRSATLAEFRRAAGLA